MTDTEIACPEVQSEPEGAKEEKKVEIADGEMELAAWTQIVAQVHSNDPDLAGRTFHEVQLSAAKIRLGSTFANFEEFEFSLDCWCVLHSRASAKVKTKAECRVRICRYGAPMRRRGTERVESESGVDSGMQIVPAIPKKVRKINSEFGACGEKRRLESAGRIYVNHSKEKGMCGEVVKGCGWRVRANKCAKNGIISITICQLKHTCPGHVHYWRGPRQKSLSLAKVLCGKAVADQNASNSNVNSIVPV